MNPFRIELSEEKISSNSGLIIVGEILDSPEFTRILKSLSRDDSSKNYKDIEIIKTYLALLSLGKTNYEDVDIFKGDEFFKTCIGLKVLPSKESLRQRLDELSGEEIEGLIKSYNTIFIKKYAELTTCCESEYIPLDFDVSPFDNSGSHKEGVSFTYKKLDGYAPMFTYIGAIGHMLNNELREGKAHSNCEGTPKYIRCSVEYARQITDAKLLCRFDSGNDSVENIDTLNGFEGVYYIIKKNFRRESTDEYIAFAMNKGCITETPRKGKTIYYNSKRIELPLKDEKGKVIKYVPTRLVVKLIERTSDAKGQLLLLPTQDIEGWHTRLDETHDAKQVISFYADHGTSEQFHSEIKTDMDMERLPSGKFSTNSLVLTLGGLAFNILRSIGQNTLKSGMINRKREVKRIRIRKVLQDIMYMACHFMIKCKQKTIKLYSKNAFARRRFACHGCSWRIM